MINAHTASQLRAEAKLLRFGVSIVLSVNTPTQFEKYKDRGVELERLEVQEGKLLRIHSEE